MSAPSTSTPAAAAAASKADATANNNNNNRAVSLVDLVVCRIYQHAYQENEMRAEEPRILVSNITPDVKDLRSASKDEASFAKWGEIMTVAAARGLAKCESGAAHVQLTPQGVIFVEQRLPPSVRCSITPVAKVIKAVEATVRHLENNLTPVPIPAADLKEPYHHNFVWDYSTDVHPGWRCFPPGDMLPIITPRNAGPHMIRSELLLYTRAARVKRDQYKHCKEYFDDAECSRGAECFFVHAISVANLGPKWGRPKPLPDSVRNKPRTAPIPRSLIAAAVAATTSAAVAAAEQGGGGGGGQQAIKQRDNSLRDGMFQQQGPPGQQQQQQQQQRGGNNKDKNDGGEDDYDDDYDEEEPLYVSIADVMLCRVYQRAVSSKAKDTKATVRLTTIMDELEKMRPQCYDSAALDKWQFVLEVCEGDVNVNNKDGEISLTPRGIAWVEKILPDEAVRRNLTTHAKLVDALDGSFEHRAHVNYLWNSLAECSATYDRLKSSSAVPAKLRVTVHDEPQSDMLIPAELVLKTRATRVPRNTYVHCAHYYKRESCELGAICKYVHAVSLVKGRQWGKPKALPAELDTGKGPDPSDQQYVVESARLAAQQAAVAAVMDNGVMMLDNKTTSEIASGTSSKKSTSNVDVSSLLSPTSSQPSASMGSNGFAPIVAPSSASSSKIDNSTSNDKQLQRFASSVLDDDDEDFSTSHQQSNSNNNNNNVMRKQQQAQAVRQQQYLDDDSADSDDDDDGGAAGGAAGGNKPGGKQQKRDGRLHQNRLYSSVNEIPYDRFDANAAPADTLQVEIAGGGKLANVPRNQILKTGAVRIERRLYKHCKDFFDEGECHRGHKCKYVHTAFLNSGPVYGSFARTLLAQYQQQQADEQKADGSSNGGGGKKRYDVSLVDAMLCRLYQRAINSSSDPSPTGTVRANFVGDDLRELKQITRDGNKFDRLKDLIAGAQDRAQAYKGGADVALTAKGAQYVVDRGLPRSVLSQVSSKVEDLVVSIATLDGVLGNGGGGKNSKVDLPAPRGSKQEKAANSAAAAAISAPSSADNSGFGFSVNASSLSIPAPNSKQPVGGGAGSASDLKFNSDFLFGGGGGQQQQQPNNSGLVHLSGGSIMSGVSGITAGTHRMDEADDDDDLLNNLTPVKLAQKQQQQQYHQPIVAGANNNNLHPPFNNNNNNSNNNNNNSDVNQQLRALERDKTRLLEELVRSKERSDFADQEIQLLREKNNALVAEVSRLQKAAASASAVVAVAPGQMLQGGGGGNNGNGLMPPAFLVDRPHQVDFAACGLPQRLDPGTLVTAPERSPLREVARGLMRSGGSLLPRPSPVAGFTLESIDVLACDSTGFEARVKRLELARKTAARASAPYLELDSAERLHLYIALMERFLPRGAGAAPSQPNLIYVYQGTDLAKLSNVANGLLDASGSGATAGLIGSGINVSTNIEYAAKEATGETDQNRPPPRRRTDGCVPVVWCIAAVGAAFPVTRGDDCRNAKVKAGFDCHVAAINETNGFAGVVPRKDMQYQMLMFDQDLQVLPIAVLWLKEL